MRRYERGIFGSLLKNGKRFYKPALGVILIVFAVNLYNTQPFVSTYSPGYDQDRYYAMTVQNQSDTSPRSDVPSVYTLIEPDLGRGTLKASTTWHILLQGGIFTSSVTDAESYKMSMRINSGLTVSAITANGVPLEFTDLQEDFMGIKFVTFDMPYSLQTIDTSYLASGSSDSKGIELVVEYGGYFKVWRPDAVSGFLGLVISPQYLQFASSVWEAESLPPNLWSGSQSRSVNIAGSTAFHNPNVVDVVLPENLMLINKYISYGVGPLADQIVKPWVVSKNEDGTKTWRFSTRYMGPVDYYAADYQYERIAAGERYIDFYFARKNLEMVEKYHVFDMLSEVYEYCATKISPRSPRDIVIVQTQGPGEINFSEDTLTRQWGAAAGRDSYVYTIILQWWSDMRFVPTRNRDAEELAEEVLKVLRGEEVIRHEWNGFGIAEYISYRYAKESLGEEYADASYVDNWKNKASDYYRNFYVRNPEYAALLPLNQFNLLMQQQIELRNYYTMPLKIWKAAQIIGEDKMDEVLSKVYREAYLNVEAAKRSWSELSVDDFWSTQRIARPTGAADEYYTRLYQMFFGQAPMPGSSIDFNQEVATPSSLMEEFGLKQTDALFISMKFLYDSLLQAYQTPMPTLAYTDFLEACGLTAEDLELTEEDFKI